MGIAGRRVIEADCSAKNAATVSSSATLSRNSNVPVSRATVSSTTKPDPLTTESSTHADVTHPILVSILQSAINMTTPTPPKTEYYKGYDDPTADMVLEVKGGVKFRVHSYLLRAHR